LDARLTIDKLLPATAAGCEFTGPRPLFGRLVISVQALVFRPKMDDPASLAQSRRIEHTRPQIVIRRKASIGTGRLLQQQVQRLIRFKHSCIGL
jgi:hypothetical protein